MNKKLSPIVLSALALALMAGACVVQTSAPDPNGGAAASPMATQALPVGTPTASPTATVDNAATLAVAMTGLSDAQWQALYAQQTADGAHVAVLQVTADAERMRHDELSWTATADAARYAERAMTAAAAPTFVPLTGTAQVIDREVAARQLVVRAGELTSVAAAPTMIVANAKAEAQAASAKIIEGVNVFLMICGGLFFLALAYAIITMARRPYGVEQAQPEPRWPSVPDLNAAERSQVKLSNGSRLPADGQTVIVPCSDRDLDAWAINYGRLGFAVNKWDGTKGPSLLSASNKRKAAETMRRFFLAYGICTPTDSGELAITEAGNKFFADWLNEGTLPHRWRLSPEYMEKSHETEHAHDLHGHETPAGEVGEVVGGAVILDADDPSDDGFEEMRAI